MEAAEQMESERARRAGVVIAAIGLLSVAAVAVAQEQPADRSPVWGAYTFGRTHGLMRDLRTDLERILGDFLTGDTAHIITAADALVQGMVEIGETIPPRSVAGRDRGWQSAREIVEYARHMQDAAHAGRYQQAYAQYAHLVDRCIACHQDQRVWGTFNAPPGAEQ